MIKPKFHLKQIVHFFIHQRDEASVEVSGKVREITLFRHSEEIGYLVETHQKDQAKYGVHRYVWLVEEHSGPISVGSTVSLTLA